MTEQIVKIDPESGHIVGKMDFTGIKEKFFRELDWNYCYKSLVTGYFLKMVIADQLNHHTFWIQYPYFETHSTFVLLTLLFGYSIQIFADFAGYSLIAIGIAGLYGYRLMENFNFPYISTSFSEFWRRWHISLSTFLREYLYIPLGGNRKGEYRRYFNQFTVFLVSGLWHGASWNYVIWGSLHGFYLVAASFRDKLLKKFGITIPQNKFIHVVNIAITFVLVSLTWVFFRNDKAPVKQAFVILHKIGTLSWSEPLRSPLNAVEMWFSVGLILFMLIKEHYYLTIPTRSNLFFYSLFAAICVFIYFFGVFTSNQFIYFQF